MSKESKKGMWKCPHCAGRAEWLSKDNVVCRGQKDCDFFGPEDEFLFEENKIPQCCSRDMELVEDKEGLYWLCPNCSNRVLHDTQKAETDIKTQFVDHVFALTDHELIEYGARAAEAESEIDVLKKEKSDIASQYASKIKSLETDRTAKLKLIRDGEERRSVECRVEYEDGQTVFISVEPDTVGVEMYRRSMTNEEKQLKLF
jgi:predicted RNA-binding Zn-ribbon protein involved in translation (DUF1610 family)